MIEKINIYIKEVSSFSSSNSEEIENFRIKYLSKKGIIPQLFNEFKTVPNDQKKEVGQKINTLKQLVSDKVEELKLQTRSTSTSEKHHDLTLPPEYMRIGSRHPISIMRREIIDIFSRIGFTVAEGPEIEDDWHVFSALNFPPDHPARDMQDTFFIDKHPDILLRTHTSSVQIREMNIHKPPIRIIMPGRVFRNEAISARAHCIFHQVEGLYIDTDVSFADLKQTLLFFAKEMYGEETQIRLRPSYFPFTEPSAELDISCNLCSANGCPVCKYTGWVEILGCGMVDPNVLEACNIDSSIYTGYAFGMGIERSAMLKFQVNDLRLYFDNDVRFLQQFRTSS
jgi:phenylalanyl-tRNA synthetase alpha chain